MIPPIAWSYTNREGQRWALDQVEPSRTPGFERTFAQARRVSDGQPVLVSIDRLRRETIAPQEPQPA